MKTDRYTPYYLSLFYFLIFAWMGIQIPYFNLYLYHNGMSAMEIGIISASIPLMRIFSPAIWGFVADSYDRKGVTAKALWLLSTLSFSLLFFTNRFELIFIIMLIYTFFWAPTLPMAEASTLMLVNKTGIDYGRIRVWGTVGFVMLAWLMGPLIDKLHINVVLWGMLFFLIGCTITSFKIPMKRSEESDLKIKSVIREVRRKEVYRFFVVAMLMIFSHSLYYGFLSIYLESLGYSKTMIGLLWALGPLCEIIVMMAGKGILEKFGTLSVLKFSLFMAAIRWLIFASTDHILPLIFAQILHAFTFGTFHIASVKHVEELFPKEMKNTAQALYSSSAYGIGLVLGTLISGFFYEQLGAPILFLLSSAVAFMAAMMIRKQTKRRGKPIYNSS